MIEVIACEMQYVGGRVESEFSLVAYSDEFYDTYQKIYNACFYEMRKALDIKPYRPCTYLIDYFFRQSGINVYDFAIPLGLSLGLAFSDLMTFNKKSKA